MDYHVNIPRIHFTQRAQLITEIPISKEEESTREALELLDGSDLAIPWFHVEKKKPTQRYKREMRQNRNWIKASLFSSTPSFILNLAHFSYPCIIPCSWSSVLLNGMAATRILPWWSVPASWMLLRLPNELELRCSVQSCVHYSLLCSIPEFGDCEFFYYSRTATAVSLTINLTCFFLCTNSSLLLSIVCPLWCKLFKPLMSSTSPWTSHWNNSFIHFAPSPPCTLTEEALYPLGASNPLQYHPVHVRIPRSWTDWVCVCDRVRNKEWRRKGNEWETQESLWGRNGNEQTAPGICCRNSIILPPEWSRE